MGLKTPLPIYVTRKTADGYTGQYTLSAWMTVWLNVVVWSGIGLYEALKVTGVVG